MSYPRESHALVTQLLWVDRGIDGVLSILRATDAVTRSRAATEAVTSAREFHWLRHRRGSAGTAAPRPHTVDTAAPSATAGSWAVIVGGDEGETSAMFNLHLAFNLAVERLGRERVILIANIDAVRQDLRRRAATGVPMFSPTLSYADNRLRWGEKARRFEKLYAPVFESGGADYEEASAETVLRVLRGTRRDGHPEDKVIPPSGIDSLFFCLSSHGGSFRSVPRLSPRLYAASCDLCGAPHRPRAQRDARDAARNWAHWLERDCNTTENASSRGAPPAAVLSAVAAKDADASCVPGWRESDRNLVPGDEVFTPYGRGVVTGRHLVGSRQRFGCEEAHRCRNRARATFETESLLARLCVTVAAGGSYTMPFISFGLRPASHRYVYRVALVGCDESGGGDKSDSSESATCLGATALGTSLATLHAFSMLSYHAALRMEQGKFLFLFIFLSH